MTNNIKVMMEEVLNHDFSSEKLRKAAESSIVDTIIATLYGIKTEDYLIKYIESIKNSNKYNEYKIPLLGEGINTSKKDSLILQGTAIVANELDEGNQYAKGHPSAHIFPSLYLSAIKNQSTCLEVLDAFNKSYEICARIAYASSMKDYMHPHGTWGNIGGTVAAAILEKKSNDEIIGAAMLSASLPIATTWKAAEKGQTVRNFYTGLGSFLAYESVFLNDIGVNTSENVIFDLWENILSEGFNRDKLIKNLFDPPLIMKNYFKVYPSCRFTHGAIDALVNMKESYNLTPEKITEIKVYTYNLAARCNSQNPKTSLESKFSIPYLLACVILDKDLFMRFNEEEFESSNISDIASYINVLEKKEYTELLPHSRMTEVVIHLKDGGEIREITEIAKGEYNNPFSKDEIWSKYKNMLEPYYNENILHSLKKNAFTMTETKNFTNWLKNNDLI